MPFEQDGPGSMENNWYKIFPLQILSHVARIPDPTMHGDFLLLAMCCLQQGGLPDDNEEISWITRLTPERVAQLRPYLNRLADVADGKLMVRFVGEIIQEREEYAERRANAGRQGGRPPKTRNDGGNNGTLEPDGDETEPFNAEPDLGNGKQCFSTESNASSEKALLSIEKPYIQTCIQANKRGNAPAFPKSPPSAALREPDDTALDEIQSAVSRITGAKPTNQNLVGLNRAAIDIFQSGGSAELLGQFAIERGGRECKLNFIAQDFSAWNAARQRNASSAPPDSAPRPALVQRPESFKYLRERKAN